MNNMISVMDRPEEGFRALIDSDGWRIGYMRHSPQWTFEQINEFQRHEESDEVFVLLQGSCCLLLGDGDAQLGTISAVEMEPLKVYSIRRDIWHSHLVDEGTDVLVVENSSVALENSPYISLTEEQRDCVKQLGRCRMVKK